MKACVGRLSVLLFVLALTASIVGPASAAPSGQDARRPFVVTYIEADPPTPKQYQDVRFRVYYDLVGPSNGDYVTNFNGEVLLRDSQNQIVERFTFDRTSASFLPDAQALKLDPNFHKWVLTTHRLMFKKWSNAATVEVWLRPLGYGGGTDYLRAAMKIKITPDQEMVARCASVLSKKLTGAGMAPAKVAWFLVGTGTSTRLATCGSTSCAAGEIAQLIVRSTGEMARVILYALNLNNVTGLDACARLIY